MECINVGKITQRFGRLLLKSNARLDSQAFRSTTTTTTNIIIQQSNNERDNNKFRDIEGHITNRIYQACYARLVSSTFIAAATTATYRPVYSYFIHLENHTVNQQPFTRHNRNFCTAKTIRKKMVRFFVQYKYNCSFCANLVF